MARHPDPTTEQNKEVPHVETLQCGQCRKRWQVGWMEAAGNDAVEHSVTCDCGRVLKTVRTADGDSPVMILQHDWRKTVAACLPAFIGGALYPVLEEPVLLILYMVAWIACGFTFVNEDNSDLSACVGIAIWSLALISAAAALGALAAHALYWWWQ